MSNAVVYATDASFDTDILKSDIAVLVDYWAPWCGPCKMIAPVLEELSSELGESVKIAKVNVDDNPMSAGQYGVMSIPTLVLFKDGQPVDKVVGFQSKDQLKNLIARA
jgi:thioredoxin 1